MVSAREIQAVAELLQVSPEGLQKAITFKVTVSPWWLGPLHAPCCVGPLPLSPASHSCQSLGWAQSWVPQTPKALQPPGLCMAVPVFTPTQPSRPNIDIACSREPPRPLAGPVPPTAPAHPPFPRLTSLLCLLIQAPVSLTVGQPPPHQQARQQRDEGMRPAPWLCLRPVTPAPRSPLHAPPPSSLGTSQRWWLAHCHSEPPPPTPQETMREKIFTPLTVESAVDAR